MTIAIRPARVSDAPIIVDFNRLLAQESEDLDLPRAVVECGVDKLLRDRALGRYFLAEEAGRILGQAMVTYEWSDWRDGLFWWIQSVYVVSDARRRGVFTRLHDALRDEAAREGAIGLRLYVHHSNASAQEVYLRRGMKDAGYKVLEELFART